MPRWPDSLEDAVTGRRVGSTCWRKVSLVDDDDG